METLDLRIGDLVIVQLAQAQLVMLVQFLFRADEVYLPEGESLATAPFLMPDAAPNALRKTLLCGPAQVYEPGQKIDIASFAGKPICVDVRDVLQHVPRGDRSE